MSRTNFHGPKDVRAIEVRLYIFMCSGSFVILTLLQHSPIFFLNVKLFFTKNAVVLQ